MKLVAVLSTTVLPLDGVYNVETLPKGELPNITDVPHFIGHPDTKQIVETLGSVPASTKLFVGLNSGEQAVATGYESEAISKAVFSVAANTSHGRAVVEDRGSIAVNTGGLGSARGEHARTIAVSSGNFSSASVTAHHCLAACTGIKGKATAGGEKSIAVSVGSAGAARGSLGSWLVLAEWKNVDRPSVFSGEIIDVQSACVDGEVIKANTWYRLICGEFVEVEEEITDEWD